MYFRNKHRLALLTAAIVTWLSVTAGPVSADDKVFDVVARSRSAGWIRQFRGSCFNGCR